MKKDEFKEFVKKNPKLINYVKNNEMTWQKFYEIYDLYGESNEVWNKYLDNKKLLKTGITSLSISEVVNWFKNIDLDGLQEGIGNVQRVIGLVQDFSNNKKPENKEYKPRPLYKHFED